MAKEPRRKPVKVGVHEGDGPPPGYQWTVLVLDQAHSDAMSFLDETQYAHIARQFRELAKEEEPTQSATVDVRANDGFHELRDKGGVLKKINARVFFYIIRQCRVILVLGAMNKKNDGKTPDYIRVLMRYRLRKYLGGQPPE